VTISTTVVMLAVMDFGIAFTLTNLIARAFADDDRAAAQRYYATAFWICTVISVTVGVIALFYGRGSTGAYSFTFMTRH